MGLVQKVMNTDIDPVICAAELQSIAMIWNYWEILILRISWYKHFEMKRSQI